MTKLKELQENLECLRQILSKLNNSQEGFRQISINAGIDKIYGTVPWILNCNGRVSYYRKLQRYCYEKQLGIKAEYCIPDNKWYQDRLKHKNEGELEKIASKAGLSLFLIKLVSKSDFDMEVKDACRLYDAIKDVELNHG